MEGQSPSPVGGIPPEVEVSVNPLPTHVNRVVLPREAEPVSVDSPEGAVQGNRSARGDQILGLTRLWVHFHDGTRGDREHLLLACDKEPRGRRRSFADGDGVLVLVGDRFPCFVRQVSDLFRNRAVVDGLNRTVRQHE